MAGDLTHRHRDTLERIFSHPSSGLVEQAKVLERQARRWGGDASNSSSLGPKKYLNGTRTQPMPIASGPDTLEVSMTAPQSGAGGGVVVGVDGSASSAQALRWAAGEARVRGSRLEAIQAWEGNIGVIPSRSASDEPFKRQANESLAAAVDGLPADERPAKIESRAVQGQAAAVLIDASAGADLLVVGSHGHGGVAGALLGSVSRRVAEHAHCPVVIVRELH